MRKFAMREVIQRPIDEVFDFISDPAHGPLLIDGIASLEPADDAPIAAGTKLRAVRRTMGREADEEFLVSAYEPPHLYALAGDSAGVRATMRYELTGVDGGTEVMLTIGLEARGLARLFEWAIFWLTKRGNRGRLAGLKRAIEAGE